MAAGEDRHSSIEELSSHLGSQLSGDIDSLSLLQTFYKQNKVHSLPLFGQLLPELFDILCLAQTRGLEHHNLGATDALLALLYLETLVASLQEKYQCSSKDNLVPGAAKRSLPKASQDHHVRSRFS